MLIKMKYINILLIKVSKTKYNLELVVKKYSSFDNFFIIK